MDFRRAARSRLGPLDVLSAQSSRTRDVVRVEGPIAVLVWWRENGRGSQIYWAVSSEAGGSKTLGRGAERSRCEGDEQAWPMPKPVASATGHVRPA
jgi:hypothetical protein